MSRQSRLRATQKRKKKKGGPGRTLSSVNVQTPQQQADAAVRAIQEAAKAQGIEVHVKRERRQQKR